MVFRRDKILKKQKELEAYDVAYEQENHAHDQKLLSSALMFAFGNTPEKAEMHQLNVIDAAAQQKPYKFSVKINGVDGSMLSKFKRVVGVVPTVSNDFCLGDVTSNLDFLEYQEREKSQGGELSILDLKSVFRENSSYIGGWQFSCGASLACVVSMIPAFFLAQDYPKPVLGLIVGMSFLGGVFNRGASHPITEIEMEIIQDLDDVVVEKPSTRSNVLKFVRPN